MKNKEQKTFEPQSASGVAEKYAEILLQVKGLMEGVDNPVGVLANVAALLKEAFDYYFWVGFYVVRHGELQLGPFQGSLACFSIKHGRGVCGTSWAEARTLMVSDVHAFPGHIACSSRSQSEIVVPVMKDGVVVAVIDVDSSELDSFHEADQQGLEAIAQVLGSLFPIGRLALVPIVGPTVVAITRLFVATVIRLFTTALLGLCCHSRHFFLLPQSVVGRPFG